MPLQELKHRLLQRKLLLERQLTLFQHNKHFSQEHTTQSKTPPLQEHELAELKNINQTLLKIEQGRYNKVLVDSEND